MNTQLLHLKCSVTATIDGSPFSATVDPIYGAFRPSWYLLEAANASGAAWTYGVDSDLLAHGGGSTEHTKTLRFRSLAYPVPATIVFDAVVYSGPTEISRTEVRITVDAVDVDSSPYSAAIPSSGRDTYLENMQLYVGSLAD